MVPNGLRPLFKLLNACDRGEDDGVEILSSKRRGSTRVHTLLLSLPLTAARARDRVEKLFFSVFRVFFLCFSRIFDVSKCISPVLWCRESRLTRELEITEEIHRKRIRISETQKLLSVSVHQAIFSHMLSVNPNVKIGCDLLQVTVSTVSYLK